MKKRDSNHQDKISSIIQSLRGKYDQLKKRRVYSQILFFLAFILIGFVLFTLAEATNYFTALTKSVLVTSILLLSAAGSYYLNRDRYSDSFRNFIEKFLNTNRKDGEQLLNLIDLHLDDSQKQSVFYNAALESNLKATEIDSFDDDLNRYVKSSSISQKFRLSSGIITVALISFTISALTLDDGLKRSGYFWVSFDQPNPYEYVLTPGSKTVEHGYSFRPEIEFIDNQVPGRILLSYKTDVEENYRDRPFQRTENGTYKVPDIELTSSITWHVKMDEFRSEENFINVQLQPRFDELTITVTPPSYTGLTNREITYPFTDLRVYRGSTLELRGNTNKPLENLVLKTNSDSLNVEPAQSDDDHLFRYSFETDRSDTLSFAMRDIDGLSNRNPFRFILNVIEDEPPFVTIQNPTGTVMKSNPQNIDITYRATDDFGLTRSELHWEHQRAFVDQPAGDSKVLETPQNSRSESFTWNLEEMDLRPRDELRFWIRVRDNDQISGGKWGESQVVTVQIPSLAEFYDEMDREERDVQSGLDNISDQYEELENEYERFLERLRQNPEGGFEEQEMLESVTEQQRDIEEEVKKLQERFEQLQSEIEQNESVSESTKESYRELQQLMEELDDPDFRKALEELREAMENMSPDDINRALEDVSFNEELYKERLERTKELFKQLKMNSDLNKLADQYEDLAERMKSDPEATMEDLKKELETANEDLDSLSDQLENLDNNPPSRSEEQLKKLKEEAKQQLEQIKEQMKELQDENSSQSDDGNGESSPSEEMQQQQDNISQQLQQEADKMRQNVEQMSGQQMNVNILALQRSLHTLLDLSETQEYLTKDASETRNQSQGFVPLARQQSYVKNQFSAVADSIFKISAELPGIPNRVNRKKAEVERVLQRSIDQIAERNQRGATITTRESLGGINELASTIASLIDQLMDQQGGGSGSGGMSMEQMIEQMQNMSGDQQQLNQQLQDMVNDMQGERLSQEQDERLEQMARQQNEIRKQLQQLQRSGALKEGDQALSEMERMIEEMEDSINDMRGGMTDPMMIERQQNILSRMLQAEESMEQRGEEEEREGTAGDQQIREFPPDMTLEELKQEIRARLQDPNYTQFSEEYRRLIEQYFEQLRLYDDEVLP